MISGLNCDPGTMAGRMVSGWMPQCNISKIFSDQWKPSPSSHNPADLLQQRFQQSRLLPDFIITGTIVIIFRDGGEYPAYGGEHVPYRRGYAGGNAHQGRPPRDREGGVRHHAGDGVHVEGPGEYASARAPLR